MKNIFTKHPHSLEESYFEHLFFALKFGTTMLLGGLACILHAIFPFLFEKTGSNLLLKMTHNFVERMPVAEERVIYLSKMIESKVRKQ
jgi:hypothetical protein